MMPYYGNLDIWELFDLEKDPSEIKNVYHEQEYKETAIMMKKKLKSTMNNYGDSEGLARRF